ncbi:MAG: Fe-S cluster assembly protein IscX [Phycisphaerae bacterium]|nr:Fe-S cluster assembly protein IscX [Phycisphaerae bacterium]
MSTSFHWLDVELIGELLAEHYPERDPMRTGFVELKRLVTGLPGFREEPGHPVNEKILEHIQKFWIEAREDLRSNEDD